MCLHVEFGQVPAYTTFTHRDSNADTKICLGYIIIYGPIDVSSSQIWSGTTSLYYFHTNVQATIYTFKHSMNGKMVKMLLTIGSNQ